MITLTGIFGRPAAHSFSPAMHNAAFRRLDLDWLYLPFEVGPDGLEAAMAAIPALGLRGVNVTIPHKETAIRFLDAVDPRARETGSVNTVVNRNGRLTGYTTDGPGLISDLAAHGFRPRSRTALVIGSGGAARAVTFALVRAGARKVYVAGRNGRAVKSLAAAAGAAGIPLEEIREVLPKADLAVNTTPVGMKPGDPSLLKPAGLHKGLFVYDIVYNRETELVKLARRAGLTAAGGLGMLLFQGALAFELWTGRKAPIDVMRRALLNSLRAAAARNLPAAGTEKR